VGSTCHGRCVPSDPLAAGAQARAPVPWVAPGCARCARRSLRGQSLTRPARVESTTLAPATHALVPIRPWTRCGPFRRCVETDVWPVCVVTAESVRGVRGLSSAHLGRTPRSRHRSPSTWETSAKTHRPSVTKHTGNFGQDTSAIGHQAHKKLRPRHIGHRSPSTRETPWRGQGTSAIGHQAHGKLPEGAPSGSEGTSAIGHQAHGKLSEGAPSGSEGISAIVQHTGNFGQCTSANGHQAHGKLPEGAPSGSEGTSAIGQHTGNFGQGTSVGHRLHTGNSVQGTSAIGQHTGNFGQGTSAIGQHIGNFLKGPRHIGHRLHMGNFGQDTSVGHRSHTGNFGQDTSAIGRTRETSAGAHTLVELVPRSVRTSWSSSYLGRCAHLG